MFPFYETQLLTSLLKETGWGERSKGEENGTPVTLPIDWVVDIADKDGDWFIGTATGYTDANQTLRVMVPDRDAPTWTGDVALHPLVCSCALFRDRLCDGLRLSSPAWFLLISCLS